VQFRRLVCAGFQLSQEVLASVFFQIQGRLEIEIAFSSMPLRMEQIEPIALANLKVRDVDNGLNRARVTIFDHAFAIGVAVRFG